MCFCVWVWRVGYGVGDGVFKNEIIEVFFVVVLNLRIECKIVGIVFVCLVVYNFWSFIWFLYLDCILLGVLENFYFIFYGMLVYWVFLIVC